VTSLLVTRALAHLDAFLARECRGYADDDSLVRTARALSERYTTGMAKGDEPEPDDASSLAYLAHFGPRAIVATAYALRALEHEKAPVHVVDVGAGSGAASLVFALWGTKKLALVERSEKSLATAAKLLAGTGAKVRAIPVDARVCKRPVHDDDDVDVLFSAFTFGELVPRTGNDSTRDDVRSTFAQLHAWAPDAPRIVLVDAGDRLRARPLQMLRDALALEKRPILSPCPHQDACPALLRERDWCHQKAPKDLPPRLAQFARNVGRDDEEMALMHLVLGRVGEQAAPDSVLAIGDARVEKGRVRLPVCGAQGVRFVQALKRTREAHDALLEIERGARLPGSLVKLARGDVAHVESASDLVDA
jgi:hypothetical protein